MSGDRAAPDLDRREEDFLRLLTRHKHQLCTLIFCILRNHADNAEITGKLTPPIPLPKGDQVDPFQRAM